MTPASEFQTLVTSLFINKNKNIKCGREFSLLERMEHLVPKLFGPCQANLVLIAYASSEGSGEPAHPRSLARTSAARSYKQ